MKKKLLELARAVYSRFYSSAFVTRLIINQFTRLYYQTSKPARIWQDTQWLGYKVLKNPFDLWNYQEIIFAQKPEVLIETGTASGGSALYYACLFDLIGSGKVVSIDIAEDGTRPRHDRITYLIGSSVASDLVELVKREVEGCARVMVVLDSEHATEYVLREIRIYSDLVTLGDYLVVEDTCINGHPVSPQYGSGPMEAVEAFLQEDERFVRDPRDRKFLMTFNPKGYLRKVK